MKYLLALGLVGMAHAQCEKTVTANFIGANEPWNYVVGIEGTYSYDPPIHMCDGDTLEVTGSVFDDHPLNIWQGDTSVHQNAGTVTLYEGTYTYKCESHPLMNAQITVKSSSDPQCACGSIQPISDPGHPCDGVTCPFEFKTRSILPQDNFTPKKCCRPLKKGCMTQGKANYDSTAEIAGPCFDNYKTVLQKANDFAGKNTFLEKRGVHKQHAKEDFYKKRAEGKSKRQAIREARATVLVEDLSEKVKKRARGVVKVAIAINSGEDSCELGVTDDNCGSIDLAGDRTANETTILTTEDADGSWAVVVDGSDIIVKQTKKSDGTFDMQCWDGSWNATTNYDVSNDTLVKTHTCHDRVFLIGSVQLACDANTCPDGCGDDGLCSTTTNGTIEEFKAQAVASAEAAEDAYKTATNVLTNALQPLIDSQEEVYDAAQTANASADTVVAMSETEAQSYHAGALAAKLAANQAYDNFTSALVESISAFNATVDAFRDAENAARDAENAETLEGAAAAAKTAEEAKTIAVEQAEVVSAAAETAEQAKLTAFAQAGVAVTTLREAASAVQNAEATEDTSSTNTTDCDAIRDTGNATAFIEGQCCKNC